MCKILHNIRKYPIKISKCDIYQKMTLCCDAYEIDTAIHMRH